MPLRLCDGDRLGVPCRALFAVGLARCPHCKSDKHHEFGTEPGDEEHPMSPKITRTGGASVAAEAATGGAETGEPQAEVPAPTAPPAAPGLDKPERPAVNARKDEHLAYAEEAWGLDPELLDESHTKRQLLTALDRLDAGELTVVGGELVETAPSGETGPEPNELADHGSVDDADESYESDYTDETA